MLVSMKSLLTLLCVLPLLSVCAKESVFEVGVARVDITPDYPIRLNGYLARKAECDGVIQHVFAKALAIGTDKQGPAILISVDNCILPATVREEILQRLKSRGVRSEKLAICVSHTHSAPKLKGAADNIFGRDATPEEQAHIDRYTREFIDKVSAVAMEALDGRKPATLSWAQGTAGFAGNRRTKGGPTDHDLPVLKVTGTNGELRALLVNYACHCTTLSHEPNQICGDWAGYAQEYIEQQHPGAIAMTIMGCGADSNPFPRGTLDNAKEHGQEISKAVDGLLSQSFKPLDEKLECRSKRIELDFQALPTRQEWERRTKLTGPSDFPIVYHANKNLARLDRGEKLPTQLPYLVQEWNFGDEMAMVFLCGEVVVDYSLRLKGNYDKSRLWVNGYSNEVPCYIPSKRILKEGGYEAGGAMVYYDQPAWLADSTEDKIVDAVHSIVPKAFTSP
ncbi:MAG: hypothetical protein JWO95_2698 [Verrucomicrobiales bacterium]|nr:hypothetical protein [Verrucomicrobiales bacterium]